MEKAEVDELKELQELYTGLTFLSIQRTGPGPKT